MMNRYYLKLTTLTPVHIGTSEVYEPTNFVIDDGYLYEFDEVLFYKSLDEMSKKSFDSKLNDLFQMISFYKQDQNIKKAKNIHFNKVKISNEINNKYKNQFNKDGSANKNQLTIEKTYKDPNTNLPIIPGSSIKGVFDTFLKIYAKPEVASNETRQQLKISDVVALKADLKIGIAKRVHKNPDKKAKSQIPINIEIIDKNSEFIFTIDTDYKIEDILKSIKSFYQENKRSNPRFTTSNNHFTMRVGKFCGKPFAVYNPKNIKNSYGKEIATHTLFEDNEFGWVKVEALDNKDYNELMKKHLHTKEEIIDKNHNRTKEIKNYIKQQELKKQELIKQKELEKQKRAQEEKEQKEADFQKAKESEDIEFLENFVIKYQREDMSFYQDRLNELKAKQKDNKLKSLEETAKKAYDRTLQKRGTKAFKKQKDKYINKWSADKNNKGSKYIMDLVEKMQKIT